MRARAVIASALTSLGVLAVGWQLGNTVGIPTPPVPSTDPTTPNTDPATPAPTPVGPIDGTYVGAPEDTVYGVVQVQITVAGGRVTDVTPLQLTDFGGRSVQISNYATPILHDEVIASQSANVNAVSGATYTTEGYLASVQSALDKAGF